MNTFEILPHLQTLRLKNFRIETLQVNSLALHNNPLGDSSLKLNPILVPNDYSSGNSPNPATSWPVIFVLAGFSGNSPFYFNAKFNELNAVQTIDRANTEGQAPSAFYVFVDALTSWGGSQFINSSAVGNYQDYIINEIVPAIKKHYPVSSKAADWAVVGGSSGGYGALQLSSQFPDIFGHCLAIAPDSFFSASLLPDLYAALPYWEKNKNARKILEDVHSGKIQKQKNWHSLLNAFGMSACYAPANHSVDFQYPLEPYTGVLIPEVWQQFLEKDPIHFLPARIENLRKLSSLYFDVGTKDNYHLQYGTRQIVSQLQQLGVAVEFTEFDGNHFDIGERRIEAWRYLSTQWRS